MEFSGSQGCSLKLKKLVQCWQTFEGLEEAGYYVQQVYGHQYMDLILSVHPSNRIHRMTPLALSPVSQIISAVSYRFHVNHLLCLPALTLRRLVRKTLPK